jgi:DNA-binding transcriptional LysR family regulator
VCRRTYAAPAYLDAYGEPAHPKELGRHHCVSYTGVTHPLEWLYDENGSRLLVRIRPRMIVDLAPAAVMAAVDRVGITQLLSYQAAPEVLGGSLQRILAAFEPDSIPVNLLHIERKGSNMKIRSFVEFVTETLRRNVHLQFVDVPNTGKAMTATSDIASRVASGDIRDRDE